MRRGWTPTEQRHVALYRLLQAIAWLALTFADSNSWLRRSMSDENEAGARVAGGVGGVVDVWTKLVAQQLAMWVVFSACGLAVVTKGWNEGYSRKVCHVVMYLTPFLVHLAWPSNDASADAGTPSIWDMSWTVWFQFLPFYLQIKPLRRRSTFLMLVFRAYDRAQDRPHTLTWLLTPSSRAGTSSSSRCTFTSKRAARASFPGRRQNHPHPHRRQRLRRRTRRTRRDSIRAA